MCRRAKYGSEQKPSSQPHLDRDSFIDSPLTILLVTRIVISACAAGKKLSQGNTSYDAVFVQVYSGWTRSDHHTL